MPAMIPNHSIIINILIIHFDGNVDDDVRFDNVDEEIMIVSMT